MSTFGRLKKLLSKSTKKKKPKNKGGRKQFTFPPKESEIPRFIKTFPTMLKKSTLKAKAVHLRCLQAWLRSTRGVSLNELSESNQISQQTLRDFAFTFGQENFRRQSALDYIGTARSSLEENNWLDCSHPAHQKFYERTVRLAKLSCDKEEISKAPIPDFSNLIKKLTRIQSIFLNMWIQSALRYASISGNKKMIKRLDVKGEEQHMLLWVSDFKFIEQGASHAVRIACTCNTGKVRGTDKDTISAGLDKCAWSHRSCPAHNDVDTTVCEDVKKIMQIVGGRGHSTRRAMAVYFRIRIKVDGISIEEAQKRVNAHFKWARGSGMLAEYSLDFHLFEVTSFPKIFEITYQEMMGKEIGLIAKRKRKDIRKMEAAYGHSLYGQAEYEIF